MYSRVTGTRRFAAAVTAVIAGVAFLVVTSPVPPAGADAAAAPAGAGRALAGKIDSGPEHTCAILEDGGVRCWGRGDYGRLGYGSMNNVGDDELPGSLGAVYLGPGRTAGIAAEASTHRFAIAQEVAIHHGRWPGNPTASQQVGLPALQKKRKHGLFGQPAGGSIAPGSIGAKGAEGARPAVPVLHCRARSGEGSRGGIYPPFEYPRHMQAPLCWPRIFALFCESLSAGLARTPPARVRM